MACFIVPAVEAIVVTVAYTAIKKKEMKLKAPTLSEDKADLAGDAKIAFSKKLSWLMGLLWGGVALLAFEHFWHGEIALYPPFLTAMLSKDDTTIMLHEMATVGVSMAVMVTAVWGVICAFADSKVKSIKKALAKDTQ